MNKTVAHRPQSLGTRTAPSACRIRCSPSTWACRSPLASAACMRPCCAGPPPCTGRGPSSLSRENCWTATCTVRCPTGWLPLHTRLLPLRACPRPAPSLVPADTLVRLYKTHTRRIVIIYIENRYFKFIIKLYCAAAWVDDIFKPSRVDTFLFFLIMFQVNLCFERTN